MKSFLSNAIQYRRNKGITQKELAKYTGLSQQTISFIETGKREPTLSMLIKYLNGLDIDLNDVFIYQYSKKCN